MRISITHANAHDACAIASWQPHATVGELLAARGYTCTGDERVTVDGTIPAIRGGRAGPYTRLRDAGLREGSMLRVFPPDHDGSDERAPLSGDIDAAWQVSVISGADAVPAIAVPRTGTLHVGRSAGAEVTVRSNTASRQHCTIERVAEGVRLRDSGSRNGTRIGASDVGHAGAVIRAEQHVWVGESLLAVRPGSPEPTIALTDTGTTAERGTIPLNRPPRVRQAVPREKLAVPTPRELGEPTHSTG